MERSLSTRAYACHEREGQNRVSHDREYTL